MKAENVSKILMAVGNKLSTHELEHLKARLEVADDSEMPDYSVKISRLRDPWIALALTVFLFAGKAYIDQSGKTILAWALTAIGILLSLILIDFLILLFVGCWWLIDIFGIMDETKAFNADLLGLKDSMDI